MPLPKHPADQGICQFWHIVPHIGQVFRVGQIIVDGLEPFFPFLPALLPDVGIHQKLLVVTSPAPGYPGQSGGVPVLLVNLESVFLADLVQEFHPLPIFHHIFGIDPHQSMEALTAAVNQSGYRQLEDPDGLILFFQGEGIRFHQGILEIRHIVVFDPFAIQGIDPDPDTGIMVIISQGIGDIPVAFLQGLDDFPGRPVPVACIGRDVFSGPFVLLGGLRHITDPVVVVVKSG